MGIVTPWHVGSSQTRSQTHFLHWQVDSYPLFHPLSGNYDPACLPTPAPHQKTSSPNHHHSSNNPASRWLRWFYRGLLRPRAGLCGACAPLACSWRGWGGGYSCLLFLMNFLFDNSLRLTGNCKNCTEFMYWFARAAIQSSTD